MNCLQNLNLEDFKAFIKWCRKVGIQTIQTGNTQVTFSSAAILRSEIVELPKEQSGPEESLSEQDKQDLELFGEKLSKP